MAGGKSERQIRSNSQLEKSKENVLEVPKELLQKFASEWQSLEHDDLSSSDYYFNSYAHFAIHEEMLKDRVRTSAYQNAILQNAHLFKGKTVLDVGSGTGILCLFAAKAGAKHVYGIECSEIIDSARKIAKSNNLDDRITFIQGKAEDVVLPVDKVDIIVSEWMGYFLLYESMLDTVLEMRDKYLAPGGLIFPDKATLHIAAIEDGEYKEEKIGYWDNVYGFDYSCVKRSIIEEPLVDSVDAQAVNTDTCCILTLDLYKCTKQDLEFCAPYKLKFQRKDFAHALVVWFDISFMACHNPIHLTTRPGQYTHWKQTVFYLNDVLIGYKDQDITGFIAVKKNSKNPRDIDIKLNYQFKGSNQNASSIQFYRLR